jgi:tRNA pseudouridine55 synthase
VVDKPSGPTSFDVVHKVRSLLRVSKVGHTGTLDPTATGVLPLCLGEATRLAGYITEGDKGYEARVFLGKTTDTQDAAGKVLLERPVVDLTPSRLEATMARFRGTIQQVPPMYSAVKVDGKRLYELARAGQEVEREARSVTIHKFELLQFGVPEFTFRVECSKGTYVRTLAADLGEALGCGAHLSALRRTKSGPFSLANAVPLDRIVELAEAKKPEALAALLVPVANAFVDLPSLSVDASTLDRKVRHGVPLELPRAGAPELAEGDRVRIVDAAGMMVALGERKGAQIRYLRVLASGRPA